MSGNMSNEGLTMDKEIVRIHVDLPDSDVEDSFSEYNFDKLLEYEKTTKDRSEDAYKGRDGMTLEKVKYVGVDTESSPIDGSLQLVQIGTRYYCFLIRRKHKLDLDKKLLEEIGNLFSKKMIIFFDGKNDSDKINEFFPTFVENESIDIQILVAKLGFTVSGSDGRPKPKVSLSDCVSEWLGAPLDKRLTMSNWDTTEELTHEQTVYASLDAWVLPALYVKIKRDGRYAQSFDGVLKRTKFLSKSVDNMEFEIEL